MREAGGDCGNTVTLLPRLISMMIVMIVMMAGKIDKSDLLTKNTDC